MLEIRSSWGPGQERLPHSKCVIVALARCLSSRSTLVNPDWSTGAFACRSTCMSVCGSRSMLVVPSACLWLSFDTCQLTANSNGFLIHCLGSMRLFVHAYTYICTYANSYRFCARPARTKYESSGTAAPPRLRPPHLNFRGTSAAPAELWLRLSP